MSNVFSKPSISAVGLNIYDDDAALLSISDARGNTINLGGDLFVTELSGEVSPNFQIMYTLGEDVYLNSFNERLSPWNLSGIYVRDCRDDGNSTEVPPAYTLYTNYGITTSRDPIKLVFNNIVFEGFVVDLKIPSLSKQGSATMSFTLSMLGKVKSKPTKGDSSDE